MNKNISVWRGVISPPTHFHIWIKDDESIYIYKNNSWQPLIPNATDSISGLMSYTDKLIIDLLNNNLHWN